MKIIQKLFIGFLLIITIMNVNALDCDYREEPFLKFIDNKIDFICRTNETHCLSYVKFNDRLLQINPEPEDVRQIGVIDKFQVNDGLVKIHFLKKNLRDDYNFTFGVKCGNETLEVNLTPQYQDLYQVQDQEVRLVSNAKFIVIGFFILFVLIGVTFFIIKRFRRS